MWGLKKMKLYINKKILSQSTLDSGEITPMMAIMHRFVEPGTYNVTVFQGDNQTATFPLIVDQNAPLMLNRIDLGAANCSCAVNPKAHTVFHAPKATKGYSVLVEKFEGNERSKVFDNKNLQEGDIFYASLLRPGEYHASNQRGAKCTITVSPLKTKSMQFTVTSQQGINRPNIETIQIDCTATGFKPENVNIQTAQPLVFTIKAPSRIKIEYEMAEKQEAQSSS
jgi:hypothetical protein